MFDKRKSTSYLRYYLGRYIFFKEGKKIRLIKKKLGEKTMLYKDTE